MFGRKRSEKGQISILLGGMMLTFIFFFAFVVNTGMLVNAKINLQNAADLAAYAGAATQARQLNQIAFLNYEMRRAYKKFIFRYYVMGNMSQERFPRADMGNTPVLWSPDGATPYGVPVVCVTFKADDNPCKLPRVPKIETPPFSGSDAITKALTEGLKKMNQIKQDNCGRLSIANSLLLSLWLWNTDPDFKHLNTDLYASNPDLRDIISVIQGLGAGLGLVPRELILRRRIETLVTYINDGRGSDLDLQKINNLRTATVPEPPQSERKIQAFLSAFYTLGNHAFPADSIKLDELLPAQLIALKDNTVRFDAYAVDYDNTSGDCVAKAIKDGVRDPLPVGVYKDPDYLTYYAVRLRAKAKLLFSPFGEVELKAYAAAQPFGSRIGPQLSESALKRPGSPQFALSSNNASTSSGSGVPNLPFTNQDNTGPGQGWDRIPVMRAFFGAFANPTTGGIQQMIDPFDIARAYHFAMAPNPYEVGKYTVPTDVESDQFMRFYDTERMLAFWAPIFPKSKGVSADSEAQNLLGRYMDGGSPAQMQARQAAIQALSYYLQRLQKGQGEMYDSPASGPAEGYNIVRLADPTRPRPRDAGMAGLSMSGGFLETNPRTLRTSWADLNSDAYEVAGRVGYSVKFVAIPTLQSRRILSDGQTPHKNPIPTDDPGMEADAAFLAH